MRSIASNARRTSSTVAASSFESGLKSRMKLRLSAICPGVDMPLSTIITFGSDATKRIAHCAGEAVASAERKISATAGGSAASVPPFTGSITTTGTSCATATS